MTHDADRACTALRLATLRGGVLDARATEHLAGCRRCAHEHEGLHALGGRLRMLAPEPPTSLMRRTLDTAAPALAINAGHVAWRPLVRAIGAALLPLPAIVITSAYALRALYGLLATVLPETLSLYLVLNYAGLLALCAALTYGAVPLLAARQARLTHEVAHG